MNAPRRGFLTQLSLGALAALGAPVLLRASSNNQGHADEHPDKVDEGWLKGLHGKHRQFFDVAAHSGGAALQRAGNFLNAYHDAYGLKESDVNVLFGAHGSGLAIVLGDAVWMKYRLGAHYSITDPATGAQALRNVYSGVGAASVIDPSVSALQQRGVRFLGCMQSVARLSSALSAKTGESEGSIREALLAGFLPGVFSVPAMIVAANRAQESGLTYAYLA